VTRLSAHGSHRLLHTLLALDADANTKEAAAAAAAAAAASAVEHVSETAVV
jgi:hypothetical protein